MAFRSAEGVVVHQLLVKPWWHFEDSVGMQDGNGDADEVQQVYLWATLTPISTENIVTMALPRDTLGLHSTRKYIKVRSNISRTTIRLRGTLENPMSQASVYIWVFLMPWTFFIIHFCTCIY